MMNIKITFKDKINTPLYSMNYKFTHPSPNKMLPPSNDIKYTIKLVSNKPPMLYTGINLCIWSKNNDVFLQRLSYTSINNEAVIDFYGPNIEEGIQGILISPETDKWNLKKIELTSTNEKNMESEMFHFNCDTNIGSSFDTLASYMEPVIKSDVDMTEIYKDEYNKLKDSILINTVEFTLIGALITAFLSDIEKAYAFALGGGIGICYIKLLEIGVDTLGQKINMVNNSTVRLCIIFSLSAAIVSKYKENIVDDHLIFIVGLLGFTMYKLGLIVTYNKKDMRD